MLWWLLPFAKAQILLDPDTVWTDYCYPEPCNFQGICQNTTDGFDCDCYFDRIGDQCETQLYDCEMNSTECDRSGNGKCLYDDSPNGFGCYCNYGWYQPAGSDPMAGCTERNHSLSLCNVYDCGGNGKCNEGEDDPDDVYCTCFMGWGGANCQYRYKDVINVQFLEMAAVLSEAATNEQQLDAVGYNCAHLWPLSLMEAPMAQSMAGANAASAEISICRCLRMYKEADDTTYPGLKDMRLDPDYSYSVDEIFERHCRDPSYSTMDVEMFVQTLSQESDDCELALMEPDLPLYLRNKAECSCLLGVTTVEAEAKERFNMPLNVSVPVACSFCNWERCESASICDFESVYSQVRQSLSQYPSIERTCAPAVLALAKSTKGTPSIAFEDEFCPCMAEIAKYCPDCGNDWFDCYPSSSDYRTLFQTYRESCTGTNKRFRTWAWEVNQIAFKHVGSTLPDMSLCISGMVTMLGREGVPLAADERTQVLLCNCYSTLVRLSPTDATAFMDSLRNTHFTHGTGLTAAICVEEFGAVAAPTEAPVERSENLDEVDPDENTTAWSEKKDIIILVTLSILFALNLLWLCWTCRTTEKSYFELGPSRVKGRIRSKFNNRQMRAGPSTQTIQNTTAPVYETTHNRADAAQLP